jgi:hypothetical protein
MYEISFVLKSCLLDIMPCSSLKVTWHFNGTWCHLRLRVEEWARQETSMKLALVATFFMLVFLAWLILQHWRLRRHIPSKHQLTFDRLHDVASQKTVILISGSVSTFPCVAVLVGMKGFNSMMCRHLNIRSVQMLSNFWTKFVLVSKYLLYFAVQRLVFHKLISLLSQDSDGLWAGRPGFESHQGQDFSVLHSIQTSYGCPPSLLPMQWVPGVPFTSIWCRGQEWWSIHPLPHKEKFTVLPVLNSVSFSHGIV